MQQLNSIGSELEGLAASLYNDLSVGKDEDEYIELSDWMDFFKRSNAQSKIKVEDINLMMVVLGFWPIDEQVKTEWAKVYYSVQALDAPTSHHLVKAAEVVLDTENMEEAEEIVEDILYAFIPDYTENRVLTMVTQSSVGTLVWSSDGNAGVVGMAGVLGTVGHRGAAAIAGPVPGHTSGHAARPSNHTEIAGYSPHNARRDLADILYKDQHWPAGDAGLSRVGVTPASTGSRILSDDVVLTEPQPW